jgi:hypothetical protein
MSDEETTTTLAGRLSELAGPPAETGLQDPPRLLRSGSTHREG